MIWVVAVLFLFVFSSFVMYASIDFFTLTPKRKLSIDKIYYINLDRRPDRKQHVLKQIHAEKIPYNKVVRFRAIDGSTCKFSDEELKMFEHIDFKHASNEKSLMGNQLSHYYVLKEMVEKKYKNIVVVQDDVVFKKDFMKHLEKVLENMPKDAEMINIGFHKVGSGAYFEPIPIEDKKLNRINCDGDAKEKYICKLEKGINPCSLAYIITLDGAKNLIEYFKENGFRRATDGNFNDYVQSKDIFYGSRMALCTGAPMGSDIF